MRNVWEVGIKIDEPSQKPHLLVYVECDNEEEALVKVAECLTLMSNEVVVIHGRKQIDDKVPYLPGKRSSASDGSNSAAVGLIGGAALGASVGGPVGAIVGGVIGAMIGKEYKGVG